MPAYGSQIIPQVPDIPSPRIPVADTTVAELVARTGTAGLAAFTNMAAMAQRAELEREQMAQRGALEAERLAFQREDSKLDYGIKRQQLAQQKDLFHAKSNLDLAARADVENDLSGFLEHMKKAPARGEAGYEEYALDAVSKFPLALETKAGADVWKQFGSVHDAKTTIRERTRDMLQLRKLEAEIAGHEKGAELEKKANEKLNKPDEPYKGSAKWERAATERDAILARWGVGTPTQSAQPSGPVKIATSADYDALPSGTEFIAPDGSKRRKP